MSAGASAGSNRADDLRPFERLAGPGAVLTGLVNLLYAVSFVILSRVAPDVTKTLSPLFLGLGGLLATPVLVAVYRRLRRTDASVALWALVLTVAGAIGAALHGGYDLANAINPPDGLATELPNQVDPRGLLAFGFTGLGFLAFGWLIRRGGQLPRALGLLAYALGVLLVIVYLARLIVLDPESPVLVIPVLLAGFLANPGFYLWLGLALLRRGARAEPES